MSSDRVDADDVNERLSERRGWTLGWSGGFLWVLIVALITAAQGELMAAAVGLGILTMGVLAIRYMAPWRHPTTSYRLLMVPIFVLFVAAVAWGVWAMGGEPSSMGLNGPWAMLLVLPVLGPFFTVGSRTWNDGLTA